MFPGAATMRLRLSRCRNICTRRSKSASHLGLVQIEYVHPLQGRVRVRGGLPNHQLQGSTALPTHTTAGSNREGPAPESLLRGEYAHNQKADEVRPNTRLFYIRRWPRNLEEGHRSPLQRLLPTEPRTQERLARHGVRFGRHQFSGPKRAQSRVFTLFLRVGPEFVDWRRRILVPPADQAKWPGFREHRNLGATGNECIMPPNG